MKHERAFPACLLACLVAWPMWAQAGPAWVGTYTAANGQPTGSEGIYRIEWDAARGRFGAPVLAAKTTNPSFLALDAGGRHLYAVNEDAAADDRVSAWAVDPAQQGVLVAAGGVSSEGSAPCHAVLDRSGRWLFVANYLTGTLAVLPVRADGSLGEPAQVVQQQGSGPDASRQQSAHAHEMLQSPDGAFVLAIDLGADRVFAYRFDAATGHLSSAAATPLPAGYGPRHAVFSADGRTLYVLTELQPAIVTFSWDAASGTLAQRAVTPLLDGPFPRAGSGAEIVLHPNGRFLFASHRGETNTVSTFRIGADGLPVRTGVFASGGIKPRHIALDPSGHYLVAAHEVSGDLRVLRIDLRTGELHLLPQRVPLPGAVMVQFGAEGR